MTFRTATLRPANADGAFILDNDGDEQLLFLEDLEHLRQLLDAVLPREAHNHEAYDPDGHVVFDSVCCGAKLYRCSGAPGHPLFARLFDEGAAPKPIIHQGEDVCRQCGAPLAQF